MTTIHMERSSEKKTRNSNQKNTDVKWIIVCLLGQIETYDGTFQSIHRYYMTIPKTVESHESAYICSGYHDGLLYINVGEEICETGCLL